MKRAVIIVAVWAGILGVGALNLEASPIYQVSGRNELFLLEEGKWRYISTMDIIYSLGYTEKDINKNTDITFFCQYPVGYPAPGGWADPKEYGYYPHKNWYIEACRKAVPPPPPLPPPPPHPSGKMPIPIPPPYKIAWGFGTSYENIDPWMKRLAEGGFNLVQLYDNYYRGTKSYRDEMSRAALKYGLQLLPYPGDQEDFETWKWLKLERKDDPAIWGWQFEEPYAIGSSVANIKKTYREIKKINPKWKIFCAFALSDWYAQGYATSGICDVFGVDIYTCALDRPEAALRSYLTLFTDAIRILVDEHGAEYCPVIMAYAGDQWKLKNGVRRQYEIHAEAVRRPIKGLAYYLTSGFLPEIGNDPEQFIWNQIIAMNKALGGYSPILTTSKTIDHPDFPL